MDPCKVYNKNILVNDQFDEYQSIAQNYIEKIQSTEPGTLTMELFGNRDKNEIVWLGSFGNPEAYDFHFSNQELESIRAKLLQMHQSIVDMHFSFTPSKSVQEALTAMPSDAVAIILDPWPGTNKLSDKRPSDSILQSYAILRLSDVEEYRQISANVESAAALHPGVLYHRSHYAGDDMVTVVEEYQDSESLISWAAVFGENAGNFASLVKSMAIDVFWYAYPRMQADA